MTTVSFRMDDEVKKQFERVCDDIGMSMSTALNVFAKRVARECRIPFVVTSDVPNAETLAALKEAERAEDMHGPFKTVADMMEALNA